MSLIHLKNFLRSSHTPILDNMLCEREEEDIGNTTLSLIFQRNSRTRYQHFLLSSPSPFVKDVEFRQKGERREKIDRRRLMGTVVEEERKGRGEEFTSRPDDKLESHLSPVTINLGKSRSRLASELFRAAVRLPDVVDPPTGNNRRGRAKQRARCFHFVPCWFLQLLFHE